MTFAAIPIRKNGPDILASWFNDLRLAGVTSEELAAALDAMRADEVNTGFVSWGGAGGFYTLAGGALQLDRPGTGRVKGQLVAWNAPQTTAAFAANTLNYVFVDAAGNIGSTTDPTSLYEQAVVLFEVFYDGTNYFVLKENHPFSFNTTVSRFIHRSVGTIIRGNGATIGRVAAGTGGAAGDRQIKMQGADVLEDHGLETAIPDSAGAPVTWNVYYRNGAGKWVRHSQSTGLPMVWGNAGTPQALTTSGVGSVTVFRLYAAKDDFEGGYPVYFAVMDDAAYANVAPADAVIADDSVECATNELAGLEMAQLGFATVQNNVAGGYIAKLTVAKSSLRKGLGSGSGAAGGGALYVTGTRGVPQSITAVGGIAYTGTDARQMWFIEGNGGNVEVSAGNQIVAGSSVGQELILAGRNDAKTVTLNHGSGLSLNGQWVGGADNVLGLVWDGALWVEMFRR